MTSKSELYQIVGKTTQVTQYLEIELGTILLVQEANDNGWYENPIDYSKAYEKLLEKVNKNTLGVSLKKLTKNINHKDDIILIMDKALEARNRFTHHIFREYGLKIHADQGRDEMIADIITLKEKMDKAYNVIQPISAALVKEHISSVKENT